MALLGNLFFRTFGFPPPIEQDFSNPQVLPQSQELEENLEDMVRGHSLHWPSLSWEHLNYLQIRSLSKLIPCLLLAIQKWKLLSHVWLFVTPWTIQSMEFARPEYRSGWPFPSPGDLPNLGIELRSPALELDSLPAESPGKPKKTGVGCLSLLQGIFLTQESNRGLLHCRRILY